VPTSLDLRRRRMFRSDRTICADNADQNYCDIAPTDSYRLRPAPRSPGRPSCGLISVDRRFAGRRRERFLSTSLRCAHPFFHRGPLLPSDPAVGQLSQRTTSACRLSSTKSPSAMSITSTRCPILPGVTALANCNTPAGHPRLISARRFSSAK
jgi:hypothetical protein